MAPAAKCAKEIYEGICDAFNSPGFISPSIAWQEIFEREIKKVIDAELAPLKAFILSEDMEHLPSCEQYIHDYDGAYSIDPTQPCTCGLLALREKLK